MPTSRELLSWVALTRAPELNVAAIATALDALKEAAGIIDAPDQLRVRAGLSAAARAFLQSPEALPTAAEVAWLDHPDHHLLAFNDARYPKALRAMAGCPVALYVDGDPTVLNEAQLAIVGTRNPTAQGRQNAFEFAEYLAKRGLGITSGLAEGIDTQAHRGALAAQGLTIAVMGTGLDLVYPRSNQALAGQIARTGALVSEFALGTDVQRANFPQRNRIIAALSLGTLVIEAARQSGSLVTARLAGEAGREVFAIPGSIHNPLARGCHQLIRQGAKLTETADDILTELNFSDEFARAAAPLPGAGMDKEHKILLDALGFDPTDLDALVARTGFNAQAVSSMMLILELEGHVQAAPGGRYSRVSRSL
jgi:DNA processing protein